MEGKRTVQVKLDVPGNRLADIHATIRQYNDAANSTVEHGRNADGRFARDECRCELDGDYNAAKNIGLRLLRRNQKGTGGGAPVGVRLNSGTVNANGEYAPAEESARAGVHAESPPR